MQHKHHDSSEGVVHSIALRRRNACAQDIIDTFPGLEFLRVSVEFHVRYISTVTARIYWALDRRWRGVLAAPELRASNFLTVRALSCMGHHVHTARNDDHTNHASITRIATM